MSAAPPKPPKPGKLLLFGGFIVWEINNKLCWRNN